MLRRIKVVITDQFTVDEAATHDLRAIDFGASDALALVSRRLQFPLFRASGDECALKLPTRQTHCSDFATIIFRSDDLADGQRVRGWSSVRNENEYAQPSHSRTAPRTQPGVCAYLQLEPIRIAWSQIAKNGVRAETTRRRK